MHSDLFVIMALEKTIAVFVLILVQSVFSNYVLVQIPDGVQGSLRSFNEKNCKCGSPSSVGKIIAGDVVAPHSVPFQVGLVGALDLPVCGGSLISPTFVLTAAHCTVDRLKEDIRVAVGEHNTAIQGDGEQFIGIKNILQHPNFTFGVLRSTYNDYSLLELSQPVTLSNITNLVCLPNEHEDENLNGIPITVTGWGKIDYDADGPNDLLMKATVQQASFAMCTEVYEQMKVNINETIHLCVYNPDKVTGTCKGDSGGPMTVISQNRVVIVALTSFSQGCGLQNFPGVGARISGARTWILENSDAGQWQCE